MGCFFMECYCFLRNVRVLLAGGKTPYERRCGEPCKGPVIPIGSMIEYHPISAKDQSRLHQFGKRCYQEFSLDMHCSRVECGKEILWLQTLRSWQIWTCQKSMLEGFPKIHLNSGQPCTRRRAQRCSSRRVGRVSTMRHANG